MKGRQYGLVALATHRWRSLFAFYTNTQDLSARHIAVEEKNNPENCAVLLERKIMLQKSE